MTTMFLDRHYAIWEACAKEGDSPALTGVFLDAEGWAVATNGFMLAVVPTQIEGQWPSQGVVVRGADLRVAMSLLPQGVDQLPITLYDDRRLEVGQVLSHPIREGRFPDWRATIRSTTANLAPGLASGLPFDPALIVPLYHAISADTSACWFYQGGSCAGFVVGDKGRSFGIIMPLSVFAQSFESAVSPRVLSLVRPKVEAAP